MLTNEKTYTRLSFQFDNEVLVNIIIKSKLLKLNNISI